MSIEEKLDLEEINKSFANKESKERIKWAYETFKEGLFLTTSGGNTSAVLPDLTRKALGFCPPVIFVDTGYFNDCTHNMLKYLEKEGNDIRIFKSSISKKEIEEKYPGWSDPESDYFDEVVSIIKHEPLNMGLKKLKVKAWLGGIMRHETEERRKADFVQHNNGLYQIFPILDWDDCKINEYLMLNKLPVNQYHFDITKGPDQKRECNIWKECGIKRKD
ncbi:MAG: Phosphoadenosine phosphosulfate reductase [Candidatus Scalindua arabica]|uniref:Phosphoadenosine phosphosulfate reductase n=1 Tax=Candidatus Scalindua arabica TaxID=1127984 RepID=A0A941W3G2_9BACT|nr:Phosphoadenosine phosphosulfate reductase [Candidatus Scalindua arabica]